MNAQSWIVLGLVLVLAGIALWHLHTRKAHCSGGCGGCPYSGKCRHKKE